jgi:hypothetical protein
MITTHPSQKFRAAFASGGGMDTVDGLKMHVYPPRDERPHESGAELNWQESFVLVWWDMAQSIGGFFRLGHEPNQDGGRAVIWSNVFTPEHVFHRACTRPIKPGDKTENGLSSDNGALSYHYDDQCVWILDEPELEVSLRLEDFHPAIDGYRKGGKTQALEVGAQHVEVACRVTGRMKVKGSTYDVDGLGMRDHGWGVRDRSGIRAHRWTVGVFDRDNSFCALTVHTARDAIIKLGWVVRGDKVIFADKVDVVARMECDGCTNRGGQLSMSLTTGERFDVSFDPIAPGVLSNHGDLACMDTLCRVIWSGKTGIGDFETQNNLQAGSRQPQVLDRGIVVDGWHRHPSNCTAQNAQ